MEYALVVDTDRCIGCSACEIACKQEHELPVGPRWIRVYGNGSMRGADKVRSAYTVTHSMHCSNTPCKDACKVGAITKREDGVVLIDEGLCIGCKDCIGVCPLGVMEFDEEKLVAQKCDLCVERLDRGLEPACAAMCPSHCIYYGDVTDVARVLRENRLLAWYKAGAD